MPNWWERKKRQLGNLTRQAGNLTEDVANVATLGAFETLDDVVSGRGFTNPLANMARSGRNIYGPVDRNIFQPMEDAVNQFGTGVKDKFIRLGDDLIQTPEENLESAQEEIAKGRELSQQNWEQYLGGIDDFGMGRVQEMADSQRFLPQYRSQQYGDWAGLGYTREGMGFQDPGRYSPTMGRGYQKWTGDSLGQDPGYQFRMDEGMKALERQASAKGMSLSPALQQEQMRYAQGLASEEADRAFGRHLGEFGAQRRVREFEEPFRYGVHSGEADRLRGAMESDRGFNLGEWATMSPELYRQYSGERQFDFMKDQTDYQNLVNRAQTDWQQQTYFPQFAQGVQAMRNPLGYSAQQAGLAQSMAQMHMQRPTWLDYANLGIGGAQAVASFL